MKTRLKNYITTVIGMLFIIFAGYLIYAKYDTMYILLSGAFGVGLVFAKDTLIKKLMGKL
jgi:hypothetical protein